jgi:heat shock protein HtpX
VTKKKTVVPVAALAEKEDVAIRQAGVETTAKERAESQMRQVGDIMRRVNQFIFLTCACGLKLKIPPNFKGPNVKCPRCNTIHDLPRG